MYRSEIHKFLFNIYLKKVFWIFLGPTIWPKTRTNKVDKNKQIIPHKAIKF
jgi:hypothetical protein